MESKEKKKLRRISDDDVNTWAAQGQFNGSYNASFKNKKKLKSNNNQVRLIGKTDIELLNFES